MSGFIVGGVVCGTLGFLFAPQVTASAARPQELAGYSEPASVHRSPGSLLVTPTNPRARTQTGPQISRALQADDLRLPRFMEDVPKDPEATKQDLIDKIAQVRPPARPSQRLRVP
jgi:hypothetical protein